MDAGIPPQTVLAWVAAAIAVAAALYAARAWPIGVRRRVTAAEDLVQALAVDLESLAGKWQAKTVELTALSEEVAGYLQAIEKKRRRIAATAPEPPANNGTAAADDEHHRLLLHARSLGHPV